MIFLFGFITCLGIFAYVIFAVMTYFDDFVVLESGFAFPDKMASRRFITFLLYPIIWILGFAHYFLVRLLLNHRKSRCMMRTVIPPNGHYQNEQIAHNQLA